MQTTRSAGLTFAVQDSMCSWATRCSCSFTLSKLSWSIQVSSRGTLLGGCFPSPVPPPQALSTVLSIWQVPAFCLPCGGSWLGCQDLPFMGAVSIWELAANSGNSSMHQAPNLYFVRQLITICMIWDWLITCSLTRKSLSWFWFCDEYSIENCINVSVNNVIFHNVTVWLVEQDVTLYVCLAESII